MCIRQELSAAQTISAPVSSTARTLSASIADDTSAFFTANVPPKPQHSSAWGSSTSSMPAHGAQQPQRPVAQPSSRSEWQVGWKVTRCGK